MSKPEKPKEEYPYKQYETDVDFYRNTYLTEIKERNTYFLIGAGGGITFLVNIVKEFNKIVGFFIWLEIGLLLLIAILVLYSMHLRTEVSKDYILIYNKFYEEHVLKNLKISDLNNRLFSNKSMKKLDKLENIIKNLILIVAVSSVVLFSIILYFKFKEMNGSKEIIINNIFF